MKCVASHSLLLLTLAVFLVSCSKIHNGKNLSSKEIQQIKSLGLLDSQEEVYQFYSNAPFKRINAGNFYSTKRIATYWLDDDKRKTQVNFAYYQDITRIDTTYLDKALTYISYMVVTRKDGSQFQVYVGGKKPVVKAFFEQAVTHWKAISQSDK